IISPERAPIPGRGGWRTGLKPVVDLSRCVNCLACWLRCPDCAVLLDNTTFVGFDYEACKGCELCVEVCPTGAVEMIDESLPHVGYGIKEANHHGQ
ncbi:MAG: 4Fe-4S binding protein, partial [Bradymonadaceae bacterium]